MKKTILLTTICVLNLSMAISQSKLSINYACSYFGEKYPTSVYTFTSDNEAQSALKMITDASGLSTNFKLVAANVPNAAAVIVNNQRYILYNQTFMYNISQRINYWSSISILAHEIGHHLNGHSLIIGGSRPNLELEADKFSGFILAKLGATLDESQSAINALVSEEGSITHPGKSARLAAIANGWYQNNNGSSSQSITMNKGKIITRPRMLFYGDPEYREQVFIKKYNNNQFELISENGYLFPKVEFEVLHINDDLKIFWFPSWTSYGYLDNFSKIPSNTLFQCIQGNAPTNIVGYPEIPGNYLIIIDPTGSFWILSDGKFVNNPQYLGVVGNPGSDPYAYYIYRFIRGSKFIDINVYFSDIEKANTLKKYVVSKGIVSK
jgi:hypothetical protein